MIEKVRAEFPNVKMIATTLREVKSTSRHGWAAVLWLEGQRFVSPTLELDVIDRIGGGDGYVGGMLYGILRQWEPEKWIQFGWASGALTTTLLTDYAQPADEEQVWSVWEGNARVKR